MDSVPDNCSLASLEPWDGVRCSPDGFVPCSGWAGRVGQSMASLGMCLKGSPQGVGCGALAGLPE